MRRALAIVLSLALLLPVAALAAPSDVLGTDESRAGMCDDFDGLPFVFCVAMCEARECDRLAPNDDRCATLARGFASVTKGAAPPCPVVSSPGSV